MKEAARQTRQRTSHKVEKEHRRCSSNGRCHPSQEKKSHTESHTKVTQRKRLRQRQRKRKQARLRKTLKQ